MNPPTRMINKAKSHQFKRNLRLDQFLIRIAQNIKLGHIPVAKIA
jgi:hypothetical protein